MKNTFCPLSDWRGSCRRKERVSLSFEKRIAENVHECLSFFSLRIGRL